MKINNIELSAFSAELLDRQISTANIDSITDWLDNAVEGTVLSQNYDFKSISLVFLVSEKSEDAAYKKISALTEALKKAELKFDDIDLVFPCVLQGNTIPERVQNSVFKVTYLLKNDWAVGDQVSLSFDIEPAAAKKIKVTYIRSWADTLRYYLSCFEEKEIYNTIAEETVYIDTNKINEAAVAASNWVTFFLNLGIDINKYKEDNTTNGFVVADDYTIEAAKNFFNTNSALTIYYNRFQCDGYVDIPTNTTYPSIVWTTGEENQYFFDLGLGSGWDIRDISMIVYGRCFEAITDVGGNGSLLGTANEGPYTMSLNVPTLSVYADSTNSPRDFKVYESSTSGGGNFVIETLESIAATPLRKYGFKSSNEGPAALPGYCDVLFNGVTLDRLPIDSVVLSGNLLLLNGLDGIGKYCEVARVQIYYKGELVKDLVPIAGNVKNCFYNDQDAGLYDIINMEFLPWSKSDSKGQAPEKFMPLPPLDPSPQPPDKFTVTVIEGTGSGIYKVGETVRIAATGSNFKEWVVESTSVLNLNTELAETSFTMPANDVKLTATYEDLPPEKEILYYDSLEAIESETKMGQNRGVWAQTTTDPTPNSGPEGYSSFVSVYSIPDATGEWEYYSNKNLGVSEKSTDKWGRSYVAWNCLSSSKTGQHITFTESGQEPIQQVFCIKQF